MATADKKLQQAPLHGPIQKLAENIWHVTGPLPRMSLERAMTIVRVKDKRLLIHSAIKLEEEAFAELEALGEPDLLVVPSRMHRMDAPYYKERYPKLRVVCPSGARTKVEEVVAVDTTYNAIKYPGVEFIELDGSAEREGVINVGSPDGATLIFNDLFFNVAALPGFSGFVMKLLGSVGKPGVTTIGKWAIVQDKGLLAEHFRRLAATPNLVRLIPGHGDVITDSPKEALELAADRLD